MNRFWGLAAAALVLGPSLLSIAAAEAPRIAIIIDDLGYRRGAGLRAVELPGPVACAILPHTPHGRWLAERAHANGKEVLLHQPMQAVGGADDGASDAESGGIDLDTPATEFRRIFRENLAAVPYASGVNIHRGSLLSRHPGHMGWLMEELARRPPLYFVDSRTTHLTVAYRIAREHGVPALERHVFLDANPDPAAIEAAFAQLTALAERRGRAVAIGHPQRATLDVLERELPLLEGRGIRLVPVGAMIGISETGQTHGNDNGNSTGTAGGGL